MVLDLQSDFTKKTLWVHAPKGTRLTHKADVEQFKQAIVAELKKWHSPYKLCIDCAQVSFDATPEVLAPMRRMFAFLKQLHMRKAVAVGPGHEAWTQEFEIEGILALGESTKGGLTPGADNLRQQLIFENYFADGYMELSAHAPVVIDTRDKWLILKDKLLNNLRLWHAGWSLLVDAQSVQLQDPAATEFLRFQKFFTGFFLQHIYGYGAGTPSALYPHFRSRHRAIAELAKLQAAKKASDGQGEQGGSCAQRS